MGLKEERKELQIRALGRVFPKPVKTVLDEYGVLPEAIIDAVENPERILEAKVCKK